MAELNQEPPSWRERYRASREALVVPRLRAVSGIAFVLISLATIIDFAVDGEVLLSHWPTRLLVASVALLGLLLSLSKKVHRDVQSAAGLMVLGAAAVHLEGMIVLAGDTGGGFPFLILLPPLAALLLPSTGPGVALLSVMVVVAHAVGLYFGPDDRDARIMALELMALMSGSFIATWIAFATDAARQRDALQQAALDEARRKSDDLLQNILPEQIADRLKQTEQPIADGFAEVTILFADLVGFTPLAGALPPRRLVRELNELFTAFDEEVERRGLEKIKTIGDCYMVASGLPEPCDDHADAIVDFAMWLRDHISDWPAVEGHPMRLRIGVNTGPVVAGVIGRSKFIYDLWGDSVNVASRMESTGEPDMVQITEETRRALTPGKWSVRARESVQVKGKGIMRTWTVLGPVHADDDSVAAR